MKKRYSLLQAGAVIFLLSAPQIAKANENTNNPVAIEQKKDNKANDTYDKQPESGYIEYNNQKIAVKEETNQVKNAKEVQVSEKNNQAMGMSLKKRRTATGCEAFYLGDKNKPAQDFIDVSSYQCGLTQKDYNYMKSKGVTGVVVKLTEGGDYVNPYAESQIKMARNAGMKVSAYHFSRFANKAQAEAEADFFAKTAKRFGLGTDTLMVNDAEARELQNGYGTQNSIYFAVRLIRTHNFKAVVHYLSKSWMEDGILDANALGNDSLWIAGYPYYPSKNNLWCTNREAWQFSPEMMIPGYNGSIDVSIDYTGRFTNKMPEPKETKLKDTYAKVWNGNGATYNDRFIRDKKQSTSGMKNKTYEARGYITVDGAKWYSLFDARGNWQGWTHEYDLKIEERKETPVNMNVKVWNGNGATYNDRMISDKKQSTSGMKNKVYKAKSYIVVDGAKWYSLYDDKGKFQGWTHEYDLKVVTEPKETRLTDMCATVWNGNGTTYSDRFITNKKQSTKGMKNKTYEARGYIIVDGAKWYSLFDAKGNWQGWTHEYDLKLKERKETPVNMNVKVWNGNGATYNDRLISNKKQSTSGMKNKVYKAKSYIVVDGAKWYSLYDDKGKFQGWTHEYDLKVVTEPAETTLKDMYATVWNGNGMTYSDRFITNKKQSTSSMKNKTYEARGYITVDGAKWYSLFDPNGRWQGWVHEYDLKLSNRSETQVSKKFKVWNGNGATYNDRMLWNKCNQTSKMKDKVYSARSYIVIDGAKWYSLYDESGNWMGWTHEYDIKEVNDRSVNMEENTINEPTSQTSSSDVNEQQSNQNNQVQNNDQADQLKQIEENIQVPENIEAYSTAYTVIEK